MESNLTLVGLVALADPPRRGIEKVGRGLGGYMCLMCVCVCVCVLGGGDLCMCVYM